MKKLLGIMVVVALFATADLAADEEITVSLSIAEYIEVTLGTTAVNLELQGPVGRILDENYFGTPLTVKSNCDVNLKVYEGFTQWLLDNSIPQEGIWGVGQPPYDPATLIYAPGINVYRPGSWQPATSGFDGATLGDTGWQLGSYQVRTDTLPDASGVGLLVEVQMTYGGDIPASSGGPVPYNGTLSTHLGILCETKGGTFGGKDWTSIPATATGSFKIYLVVSAGP